MPPSAVRIDHEFKLGHRFQFDRIVFDLLRGAIWAKSPLLAHDLTVGLFGGRVAQQKLLGALHVPFDKMQGYPPNALQSSNKTVIVCAPGLAARQPSSLSSAFVLSAFSIGKAESSDVSCTRAIESDRATRHRPASLPHPSFVQRFLYAQDSCYCKISLTRTGLQVAMLDT